MIDLAGKEWISIVGLVTTPLVMKVFAFATGTAKVEYEWGRAQTGCCLGVEPCSGTFSAEIAKDASIDIGTIPRGKKSVNHTYGAPLFQNGDTEGAGRKMVTLKVLGAKHVSNPDSIIKTFHPI